MEGPLAVAVVDRFLTNGITPGITGVLLPEASAASWLTLNVVLLEFTLVVGLKD